MLHCMCDIYYDGVSRLSCGIHQLRDFERMLDYHAWFDYHHLDRLFLNSRNTWNERHLHLMAHQRMETLRLMLPIHAIALSTRKLVFKTLWKAESISPQQKVSPRGTSTVETFWSRATLCLVFHESRLKMGNGQACMTATLSPSCRYLCSGTKDPFSMATARSDGGYTAS